ncbi:hypothetical protein BH11PSE9_BH11PSE9_17780 [soil metagenome]
MEHGFDRLSPNGSGDKLSPSGLGLALHPAPFAPNQAPFAPNQPPFALSLSKCPHLRAPVE